MGTVQRALGFALGATLTLGGCDDTVVSVLPPVDVQVDVLAQQPAALVDILWVVDNSASMANEQEALGRNFDGFIRGLTTCRGTGVENDLCNVETRRCTSGAPCNPPDYHIGVISTDVQSSFDQGRLRQVGLCTTATSATPSMNRFRYCLNTDDDCVHDPADPTSDPANSVCDMSQGVSFVTATTPGAAAAFSRAVRVGTTGVGRETGIEAAALSLGRAVDRTTGAFLPPPSDNDGFLRPDASLFIIFVADEDDRSFGEPSYYYRVFETVKGAGNEGLVSISAIVGDPDTDGESGTETGGCEAPPETPDGEPVQNLAGTRYTALAMYSRGVSEEFRICDGARLTCPRDQSCLRPNEESALPGLCAPSTACSEDADCSNFRCQGGNGCIRCLDGACQVESEGFLELLEQNGVFESICNPNYEGVLSALGFEAAGLARKFTLTETPDCSEDPVPCCASSVAPDECSTTAPVCVRLDGQPVPNDRRTGWIWDGAGNAVFFDGELVPPPRSEVQISYPLTRDSATRDCAEFLR